MLIVLVLVSAAVIGRKTPSWVNNKELRARYDVLLQEMEKPYDGTEPEYGGVCVTRSVMESHSVYPSVGQTKGYTFDQFRDTILFFLPDREPCVAALDFFFDRPLWFVARKDEIIEARDCMNLLLDALPESTDTVEVIHKGTRILAMTENVLMQIYSDEAHFVVGNEFSDEADKQFGSHIGLHQFVQTIPQLISALKPDEVDVSSLAARIKGVDGRFFKRLVEAEFTHPSIVHFPSFVDAWRKDIAVWQVAISQVGFDEIDIFSLLTRNVIIRDPRRDINPRILSYPRIVTGAISRGWIDTVSVIEQVDAANESHVLRDCLPMDDATFRSAFVEEIGSEQMTLRRLFFAFNNAHHKVPLEIPFFKCFLEKIRSGTVVISQEHVPAIMFIARIVTSASLSLIV
jgi:hypothetical protein